jgi:hypothetical protein
VHRPTMLLSGTLILVLLTVTHWPDSGRLPAADAPGRASGTSSQVIEQTAKNGVVFRALHVKRDPIRRTLVIAVYTDNVDRDGNVCRHAYGGGKWFVLDDRRIPIIRQDGFRTGSQSGQDHTILEWFATYEKGDPLATVSTIGFQVQYGFSPNPKALTFEHLIVRDVRAVAESKGSVPIEHPH